MTQGLFAPVQPERAFTDLELIVAVVCVALGVAMVAWGIRRLLRR